MKLPKRPQYRLVFGFLLIIVCLFVFHNFFTSKSIDSNYFGVNLDVLINGNYNRTDLKSSRSEPVVEKLNKTEKCRGFNPNRSQFRVTIDGITYPNIVPLYHNTSIDFACLNSSGKTKTILMWTKFKGSPLVDYGFGLSEPFQRMNCPVTNCELTDDRLKLKNADYVLFHLRNNIDFFPGKSIRLI